ncbi:chloride channel protein [Mesorhizobium album]|uniref:chloride channel protein n=1 Tax=Mesorhizobium album TaxID=3072314 RepID=UPI003D31E1A9
MPVEARKHIAKREADTKPQAKAIEGTPLPALLFAAKFAASLFSISGIPCGIFAPSLAVGTWLGRLFRRRRIVVDDRLRHCPRNERQPREHCRLEGAALLRVTATPLAASLLSWLSPGPRELNSDRETWGEWRGNSRIPE